MQQFLLRLIRACVIILKVLVLEDNERAAFIKIYWKEGSRMRSTREFLSFVSKDLHDELCSVSLSRQLEAGETVYEDGSPFTHFFLVRRGKVRVNKITADGEELTLYIALPNEMLGEYVLFDPQICFTSTAVMMEPGVVDMIPVQRLERMLLRNEKWAITFIKWLGLAYQSNQSKFRDLLLHGKYGALYSTLIRMTNTYGKEVSDGIVIDLPLSNTDLAKFICSKRETVNRMLMELRKELVLSVEDKYITIHNLNYLKEAIHCGECSPEICQI